MRRYSTLALILFAIPVCGLAVAIGMQRYFEDSFSTAVLSLPEARARGLTRADVLSLAEACDGVLARTIPALCSAYESLPWLLYGSVAAGIAASVLLLGIPMAARAAGDDRARLAAIFGPGAKVVLLSVALMVAVQGLVAAYGAYLLESEAAGRVHYFIVFIAIGGVIGAFQILRSGFTLAKPLRTYVLGERVTAQQQPTLWEMIDSLARKCGAQVPDNIVIGLQPTFFVTAAEVALFGTHTVLKGQTLYLSLPLLRMLDRLELDAVVGHELGHFKGDDTAYSLRFVPVYRGVGDALSRLGRGSGGASSIALIPGIAILTYFIEQFAVAERRLGREREIEADRNGAAVASSTAIVSALLKCATLDPIWQGITQLNIAELGEGRVFFNLSTLFATAAGRHLQGVNRAETIAEILTSHQPHPTDTHPPLVDRARALGIDIDPAHDWLALPQDAAVNLIADAEALERTLTEAEHRRLITFGIARLPDPAPA